jgi:hypothetical protein
MQKTRRGKCKRAEKQKFLSLELKQNCVDNVRNTLIYFAKKFDFVARKFGDFKYFLQFCNRRAREMRQSCQS